MIRFGRSARLLATVIVVVGLLPFSAARAQEGTGYQYSDQVDLAEFVPATGVEEQVSASVMVTLAYGFIWLLLAGLVYTIWRRSQRLGAEIEAAQERLVELDDELAEVIGNYEESSIEGEDEIPPEGEDERGEERGEET